MLPSSVRDAMAQLHLGSGFPAAYPRCGSNLPEEGFRLNREHRMRWLSRDIHIHWVWQSHSNVPWLMIGWVGRILVNLKRTQRMRNNLFIRSAGKNDVNSLVTVFAPKMTYKKFEPASYEQPCSVFVRCWNLLWHFPLPTVVIIIRSLNTYYYYCYYYFLAWNITIIIIYYYSLLLFLISLQWIFHCTLVSAYSCKVLLWYLVDCRHLIAATLLQMPQLANN